VVWLHVRFSDETSRSLAPITADGRSVREQGSEMRLNDSAAARARSLRSLRDSFVLLQL
jgi:hypothetical protein